jgi:hypothetical protein
VTAKQPAIRYGPLTITCPCGVVMKRENYTVSEWRKKKYHSHPCALRHRKSKFYGSGYGITEWSNFNGRSS